nr:hypothetical protein [Tanacetum cinerariifolium]
MYFKADKKELFCSFVYAHNRYIQRRDLWNNLATHKNYIRNRPWCIVGYFNVSLSADEKSTGPSNIDTGMRDFQDCVEAIEESDVNSTSLRAVFQPYRISNHSPALLRIPMESTSNPHPFKFSNLFVHNNRFKDIVANGRNVSVSGFWMFKVVKLLKMLKKPIRKLLYDHENLHENVKKPRHELDLVQTALDLDPSNLKLQEEEVVFVQAFKDAIFWKKILMQKAKVEWLKLGDANTTYFHKVVKSQVTRNRIDCVTTTNGVNVDVDQVPLCLLWETRKLRGWMDTLLLSFFKEAWEIIAADVTKAIKECFTNGILLKELNHTILALILKVTSPMKINDYRPISCCNIMYKCISRVISNRMKESLMDLVSLNQLAFVPGRRISDNILWTQVLMHNYHLDRGTSRCAFKVDIQKAYDTVDWKFLHDGKRGLRQGDLMSPYLFTLLMEILTLMLHKMARVSGSFTYHQYSYKLNLINICFVDDLLLFAHGDVDSAKMSKYSDLGTIGVSHLSDVNNKLVWKDLSSVDVRFSFATVWESIRPRSDEVDWYHVVWFSHQIPRHAIHLWLVIKYKLKNRDKLRQWNVSSNTNLNLLQCPLCGTQPDSHDHLFFECMFCLPVWDHLKQLMGIPNIMYGLDEGNSALFMKKKRSPNQVIDVIKSTVHLKLLSGIFKRTKHVQTLSHLWGLPTSSIHG